MSDTSIPIFDSKLDMLALSGRALAGPSTPPSETVRPTMLSRVGDGLATIPYTLGVTLMALAEYLGEEEPTSGEEAPPGTKPKRLEDADPWVAPIVFWS